MSIANSLTQLAAMLPPEEFGSRAVMLEAAEALHRKNKYIAELEEQVYRLMINLPGKTASQLDGE